MKCSYFLAAGLLALAACQADKAAAPKQTRPALARDAATAPALSPADAVVASGIIDDAADRLAPALSDEVAGAQLTTDLRLLSAALAAGNGPRARAALAAARAALGRAGATPDAAAIGLALDRAEALLSSDGPERPDAARQAAEERILP